MSSARDAQYGVDTLADCLRALKRRANDSDSDDFIDRPTNRGQKLKKRSRFVRTGRLAPPNGPPLFREVVEHAGYRRAIISQNPPLIDEEGYAIDSEDDQDVVDEAQAAADMNNPWAGIRIDEIKAPLTSVTELATNPNWSRPYTSSGLDELCTDAQGMVKREKSSVEKVKKLRKLLCGDLPFAPVGMMVGPNDGDMFDGSLSSFRLAEARRRALRRDTSKAASPKTNGESSTRPSVAPSTNGAQEKGQPEEPSHEQNGEDHPGDVTMEDLDASKDSEPTAAIGETAAPVSNGKGNGTEASKNEHEKKDKKSAAEQESANPTKAKKGAPDVIVNGEQPATQTSPEESIEQNTETTSATVSARPSQTEAGTPAPPVENGAPPATAPSATAANPTTTPAASRAVSAAPPGAGESYEGDGGLGIHPDTMFIIPRTVRPNRDMGLSPEDAEEMRKLVQLYIHKQEEIDRGTQSLYRGLLWANARRREVLKWSKAEAHCGANRDMSDGEDWYDMEEWGLTEKLKKGQDEEEEDNNTRDQPKKTRNRK